jgi:uncharacterized membrane protein
MSVTITATEITRANNPQPLGQTESGIVRANVYNDVVTDLGNLATAVNDISTTTGTVKADIVSEYTAGSGVTVDSVLLKDGYVSPTKAAYTQGTSKTTAVPITTRTGTITTFALTDAANASFSFDVTLTGLTSSNVPLVTPDINGSTGWASVSAKADTNKITITVKNTDASAAFNAAIKIHYTIL